ncbi:MAG: hypothetical protein KQA33_00830, partial [Candidatus Aenigmarchaeota archaeon]|nr:hypothetical protein [Candidatus Aenigmarchaeota archaeon]
IDGRTFCLEHAPKQAATDETKPTGALPGRRKALLTVLFLLIGTGIMLYIMQWYASKMSEIPIKEIATIVEIFQTVGLLIVEGLAGLFVILLIAYGVLRRRQ